MLNDFILGHYTVVPSSDNNNDSISVAVISGAIVGTLLLIIVMIIVIIVMLVVIVVLCRGRKKSRKAQNTVDKYVTSSNLPNPQQHTRNTSGQLQHDHTDNNALPQLGVDPTSRLETVNALYIPTEVKSLEQHGHDRSRSGVIGCDVIITPNPSYIISPNSLQTEKESEYQYDYVQTDKLVQHNKVLEPTTSAGLYNKITEHVDNINIDPNPSYSPLQDVN